MRTLYLHIGHEKTGTTFMQSVLAHSRIALSQNGVNYPACGDDALSADIASRVVTSGNGRNLALSQRAFRKHLRKYGRAIPDSSLLFSSEILLEHLLNHRLPELADIAADEGFEAVDILLLIRAPAAHAVSTWQQHVKGWQAERRDLDVWLESEYDTPAQVRRFVERVDAVPAITLSLYNYDAHKAALPELMAKWMNVTSDCLTLPPKTRVNRAMTRSEAALQLALNRTGKIRLRNVGQALVNTLPDIARDDPVPSLRSTQFMLSRLSGDLDLVDQYLLDGENYDRNLPALADDETPYTFTNKQLDIVAREISENVKAGVWQELRRRIGRRAKLLFT